MQKIFDLFDRYPAIPIGMMLFVIIFAIVRQVAIRRKASPAPSGQPPTPLDAPLFHWSPHDPFRVRDLLNGGVLILGRAGSGKTSSSGRTIMQAIVNFDEEKKS